MNKGTNVDSRAYSTRNANTYVNRHMVMFKTSILDFPYITAWKHDLTEDKQQMNMCFANLKRY